MASLWRNLVIVVFFAVVAGLWLYTHIDPFSFGTCHEVPVNVGEVATVRDCQAYGSSDFVAPLALLAFAVLLLGASDFEFTIPGFGTFKRAREVKEATEVLKQETPSLDQRGEKFLDGLPPPNNPQTNNPM